MQIKAKFLPDKDLFAFDSLTNMPTIEIPKHIKFKKKNHNNGEKIKQKTNQIKSNAAKNKQKAKQFKFRKKAKPETLKL